MANAELNVILSADGKQLSSTLKKGERDVQSFGNEVKNLPSSFGKFDSAVSKSTKNLNNAGNAVRKNKFNFLELGRVIQDLPFGFAGIANNLTQLIPGVGLLGLAFSGLVSAITFSQIGLRAWGGSADGVKDKAKQTGEEVETFAEKQRRLKEVFDEAAKAVVSQTTKIDDLGKALVDTTNKTAILTDATIKQGLAQVLFTQKEALTQKLLSDALEKQLKSYKKRLEFNTQEFKIQKKTSEIKPFRIASIDEIRAAGIGLDQTEQKIFDLNRLAQSLGLNFSQFVDDAKSPGKDKFLDNLLKQVRLAEKFINEQTIRVANFEIDPDESRDQIIKKANEFLNNVFNNRSAFLIKTVVRVEAIDLKPTQKYFEDQRKNAQKMFADLQEEVTKLTKRNQILIAADIATKTEKARGAELADSLGLSLEGVNRPLSLLTEAQRAAVNTANTINGILTPAFENMFDAIKSGESPIKAFFQGLGQAVTQLIQKLIAAALQALVLSAIFPGLGGGKGGFGNIFKSLLGFKAEGGPVLAGKPYIVGEKGPELFVPQRGGQIVPNNEMNSGLAGISAGSLHITVDGRLRSRDIRLGSSRQVQFENRNI
jgi:hypothetical protein